MEGATWLHCWGRGKEAGGGDSEQRPEAWRRERLGVSASSFEAELLRGVGAEGRDWGI